MITLWCAVKLENDFSKVTAANLSYPPNKLLY